MQRRKFLGLTASGLGTATLAGCTGDGTNGDETDDGGLASEPEEDGGDGGDGGDGEESADDGGDGGSEDGGVDPEEALEEEGVESTRDGLEILEHEFYQEDFSAGVEGTVRNDTGEELSYVEVGVVFYNADGQRIDDSFTNTEDLGDGEEWVFDVMFLGNDPEQVDDYNIVVTDEPF